MKRLFTLAIILFSTIHLNANSQVSQNEVDSLKTMLNSERIKYFFGNCAIEVLETPFPNRISNQYTIQNGQKFSRTIAVVDFEKCLPAIILKTHQHIKDGASIGLTLRNEGWQIEKKALYFGSMDMPEQIKTWMKQEKQQKIEVYAYELVISKGDLSTKYCTIVEMYSPEFLDNQRMKQLYANYNEHEDVKLRDIFPSFNTIIRNMPAPTQN